MNTQSTSTPVRPQPRGIQHYTVLGSIMRGIGIGFVLSIVFFAGFWFRGSQITLARGISPINDTSTLQEAGAKYALLEQTQVLINEHYLRPQPNQRELEYGAIRGLLQSLNDKYTFFIDPPVAASESNVLAGKYGGVGVQVLRAEDARFILIPFRDGPAARAGLKDGDILMQINDTVIDTTARQDVIDQALRGKVENNNGVTIKVLRPTTNEALTFTIAFEEINVPSVIWRVLEQAPEIGYIQILRFTNRTPTELDDAIKDLTAQSIKGVILDMRNNPGGLLQESVQVTGRFLQGGTVLIENNKNGEKSFDAPASPVGIYDLPMIVIINQGTASAAELVAGALQDRGRARILGTKSYGKGSIQVIFPLADKSSVHITTAEWFTPNKNQINEKGLTPDLPMIPSPDGRDVEINESVRQLREVIK